MRSTSAKPLFSVEGWAFISFNSGRSGSSVHLDSPSVNTYACMEAAPVGFWRSDIFSPSLSFFNTPVGFWSFAHTFKTSLTSPVDGGVSRLSGSSNGKIPIGVDTKVPAGTKSSSAASGMVRLSPAESGGRDSGFHLTGSSIVPIAIKSGPLSSWISTGSVSGKRADISSAVAFSDTVIWYLA